MLFMRVELYVVCVCFIVVLKRNFTLLYDYSETTRYKIYPKEQSGLFVTNNDDDTTRHDDVLILVCSNIHSLTKFPEVVACMCFPTEASAHAHDALLHCLVRGLCVCVCLC